MSAPSQIDQLVERVERLLQRHTDLQKSHAAQALALQAACEERDELRERMKTASTRIDALLEKLTPHTEGGA